jgi:hypothetical protein
MEIEPMFRASPNTAVALVTTGLLATTMLNPTSASAFYAARGGFAHYAGPRTSMMIRRIPETHPHWHSHLGWRHHYWVAPVVAAEGIIPIARCTCLTKQYLPDGSVLFKDLCTEEKALAPAADQQDVEEEPQQPPSAH